MIVALLSNSEEGTESMLARFPRCSLPWYVALLSVSAGYAEQPKPASIEVIRDTYGVPHIFASSLADATYAQAICHAEDNLALILEMIAASRGELAKTYNAGRSENDFMVHAFAIGDLSRANYAALDQRAREVVDAYAEGLNRYLRDHPTAKPEWLISVTGEDIVAVGKLRNMQESMAEAQKDITGASQARRERDQASPNDPDGASNMWAVRPERTTDGSVVLLSDPHLPWNGVTKWHESHLVVGDRWIYGATFPGSPGIGIGFTQDLAWGFTNNGADIGDVFLVKLDPENPDRYRWDEAWREIVTREIKIEVRGDNGKLRTEVRKMRFTHHGPIVKENAATHVAFAMRLAGLERPATTSGWTNNFYAQNLDEFEKGLDVASPNKWNCLVADRLGNIGYYFFTHTHERRDDINWNAPVDGSVSANDWGRALTWRELPHTRNPASGWIENCNNNPYTITRDCPIQPHQYPKHLASQGTTLKAGTRAERADALLASRDKHDHASLEGIAMDVKALMAAPIVAWIVTASENSDASLSDRDDHRARAIAKLKAWDGIASIDNEALPILSAFLSAGSTEPVATSGKGKRGKANAKSNSNTSNYTALSPTATLQQLDRGLSALQAQFGSEKVTWGMMHRIVRGTVDLPIPGSGSDRGADPFTTLFMTGAKTVTDGRFHCDSGSSWLQLVTYRDGKVEGKTLLPFGNSNDPASPHYADQAELFSKRQFKRALLERDEVKSAATAQLQITR